MSVQGTPCDAIEVYVFCGLDDCHVGFSATGFTQMNNASQLQNKSAVSFYAAVHSKTSTALKTVTERH